MPPLLPLKACMTKRKNKPNFPNRTSAQNPRDDPQQLQRPAAAQQQGTLTVQSASFRGPLPPPAMLAGYEAVFQGCAERVVAMAES
jgi:uncharacterized membrane protein